MSKARAYARLLRIPAISLAIFPVVWYIIFAQLIGEKLFRPRM